MPNKVIYFQGTTDVLTPALQARGALDVQDAPRRAKRKLAAVNDGDVLPPMTTPAVTATPSGWEAIESRLRRSRQSRPEESALLPQLDVTPQGWDAVDAAVRRRKLLSRFDDQPLIVQAPPAPSGWDVFDRQPRRKTVARAADESLLQPAPQPVIGWEHSQPSPFAKRKQFRAEDIALVFSIQVVPSGWDAIGNVAVANRRKLSRADELSLVIPSVLTPRGWESDGQQVRLSAKRFNLLSFLAFANQSAASPPAPPIPPATRGIVIGSDSSSYHIVASTSVASSATTGEAAEYHIENVTVRVYSVTGSDSVVTSVSNGE